MNDYVINTQYYDSSIKHFAWLENPLDFPQGWNWDVMRVMNDDDYLEVLRVHFPHAYAAHMRQRPEVAR